MKMKFSDLKDIDSQPIPLDGMPRKNGDHAVIAYVNMRNQTLNVSVTPAELESIEFSQDFKYMKKPDFLNWVKGSKGPYLAKSNNGEAVTTATNIQW